MSANNRPSPPATFSIAEPTVSDSASSSVAGRRLEDRIAEFLQGLEQPVTTTDLSQAHVPSSRSGVSGTDGGRLSQSTACPVQTHQPVAVLLEGNTDYGASSLPSTETRVAPPAKSREKRTRHCEALPSVLELPNQFKAMSSNAGEQGGRPTLRPLSASHPDSIRVLPIYNPTILQAQQMPSAAERLPATPLRARVVDVSQAGMDVPTVGQMLVRDVESASTMTAGVVQPLVAGVDIYGRFSESMGDVPRMTAVEKAKQDWETHISAMERVLAANRAQGLPSQNISAEALQLLSQMVGNLYTLNTQLLYAQIQSVLDAHHKNTERINALFRGLSGTSKRQKKDN